MPSPARSKKHLNILIVDDDRSVGTAFAFFIKSRGHIVKTAFSAEAALLQCREEAPEVVLSDINLPGKSGIELLTELRASLPRLRVILITGMPSPEVVHRGMEAMPDGFVMKTASLDEVLHTVEEVAEGRTSFSQEAMDMNRRGAVSKLGGVFYYRKRRFLCCN